MRRGACYSAAAPSRTERRQAMSYRTLIVLPLRRGWNFVKPVLQRIDQLLVAIATLFGVHLPTPGQRYGALLGIYAAVYVLGLLTTTVIALPLYLFGYVGILAVGRAWVANERQRMQIVKKLEDTDPDSLPDLRGLALVSALQVFVLFPLLFRELNEQFHLYRAEGAGFLDWFAFTFESVSKVLLDWDRVYNVTLHEIVPISIWGRHLLLLKRLTIYWIIMQGIVRLFGILWNTQDAVNALKKDADLARRVGKRAVESLLEVLEEPDAERRERAAYVLGGLRDPRALEGLTKALQDPDAGVRWRAATALGELGDPRALPALVGALHDSDASV